MYGLPIRNIEFHEKMDLVYSMDSSIVKMWEKNSVSKLNKKMEIKKKFFLNLSIQKIFRVCQIKYLRIFYSPFNTFSIREFDIKITNPNSIQCKI